MKSKNLDLKEDPDLSDLDLLTFPDDYPYEFTRCNWEKDFEELGTIGSGMFIVKSFRFKPLNRRVAIKFVKIPHNRYNDDENDRRRLIQLVREIKNFRRLSSDPNIVTCYGVCLFEGQALICMEQMDISLKEVYLKIHKNPSYDSSDSCGKTHTIEDIIDQELEGMDVDDRQSGENEKNISNVFFPEELLASIAVSILDALISCKRENVIHRDIKPDNILLNKNGEIKLCDFGEARILHDSLASSFAGTLCYWPPERFGTEKVKFDVRADVWSLGITLVEVVRGSIPYRDSKGKIPKNIILLQNLILNLDTEKLIDETFKPNEFSEETREFVRLCLKTLAFRPKYDGLKETNFYLKYGRISLDEKKNIVENWIRFYGIYDLF